MKRYTSLLLGLLFASPLAFAQEIDDMYFFKSDRKRPKKANLELPSASLRPDFSGNDTGEIMASNKFANPDFAGNVSSSSTPTYVEESNVLSQYNDPQRGYGNNLANRNNAGWSRPQVSMGFGMGTFGSFSSLAISFGSGAMMNNMWGSPYGSWGYDPYGWGNPYGRRNWGFYGGYSAWNNPWGFYNPFCPNPWGWGGGFNRPVTVVYVDNRPSRTVSSTRTYAGTRGITSTAPSTRIISNRTAQYNQRVSQLSNRYDRGYNSSANTNSRSSYSNTNSRSGSTRSYNSRNINQGRTKSNSRWNTSPSRSNSMRSFSTPSRSTRSFSSPSRSSGGTRTISRGRN